MNFFKIESALKFYVSNYYVKTKETNVKILKLWQQTSIYVL